MKNNTNNNYNAKAKQKAIGDPNGKGIHSAPSAITLLSHVTTISSHNDKLTTSRWNKNKNKNEPRHSLQGSIVVIVAVVACCARAFATGISTAISASSRETTQHETKWVG